MYFLLNFMLVIFCRIQIEITSDGSAFLLNKNGQKELLNSKQIHRNNSIINFTDKSKNKEEEAPIYMTINEFTDNGAVEKKNSILYKTGMIIKTFTDLYKEKNISFPYNVDSLAVRVYAGFMKIDKFYSKNLKIELEAKIIAFCNENEYIFSYDIEKYTNELKQFTKNIFDLFYISEGEKQEDITIKNERRNREDKNKNESILDEDKINDESENEEYESGNEEDKIKDESRNEEDEYENGNEEDKYESGNEEYKYISENYENKSENEEEKYVEFKNHILDNLVEIFEEQGIEQEKYVLDRIEKIRNDKERKPLGDLDKICEEFDSEMKNFWMMNNFIVGNTLNVDEEYLNKTANAIIDTYFGSEN